MTLSRRSLLQATGLVALHSPLRAQPEPETLWLRDGNQVLALELPGLRVLQRFAATGPLRRAPTGLWSTAGGALQQRSTRDGALLAEAASPTGHPLHLECVSASGQQVLVSDADRLHLWSVPERRWVARYPRPPQGLAAAVPHPQRQSLVLIPRGLEALWEIYLSPDAEDFYTGTVHDFQFGEGVPTRGPLGLRPMPMPTALAEARVHPNHFHVLARSTAGQALCLNLDARRPLRVRRPIPPLSATAWCTWQGAPAWAQPTASGFEVVGLDRAEPLAQSPLPARWMVGQPHSERLWWADSDALHPWAAGPAGAPLKRRGAQPQAATWQGAHLLVHWQQGAQAWLSCHDGADGRLLAETALSLGGDAAPLLQGCL